MTIIHITLVQGRSDAQKAAMFRELTAAVQTTLGVPAGTVRIAVEEIPAHHFAVAGIAKSAPTAESFPKL